MYKLVCIDMDGTLLNSKRKISDATKESLQKAEAKGVHIVITTGRIYVNAEYYSNLLGVRSAVIGSNGAIIKEKDKDEFMRKHSIPIETNKRILEICNKYKVHPRFHTDRDIYDGKILLNFFDILFIYMLVIKINSKAHRVRIHHIKRAKKWEQIFIDHEKDIIKCEIYNTDNEKLKKVKEELEKIDFIKVIGSGTYGIEITNKGVSKGTAVKYLAEQYKIKKEEIIAIGDNENDIEMIEFAGLGVAMGNAIEMVKNKANYITDTNDEDGVAKVINKFILNKKEMER